MAEAHPWTEREERLLAANPTLCGKKLSDLLAHIGPGRTPGAISKKRQAVRLSRRRRHSTTRGLAVAASGGWPRVPPVKDADRVFLAAILKALRAEKRSAA